MNKNEIKDRLFDILNDSDKDVSDIKRYKIKFDFGVDI